MRPESPAHLGWTPTFSNIPSKCSSTGSWKGQCPSTMRHLLMIETLNVRGNFFKAILDGKMTGVEPVHLCIRQILQIGFPSIACEKEYHAAMGVPCDAHHADVEGCEEQSTGAGMVPVTSDPPRLLFRRTFASNFRNGWASGV